MGLKSVQKVTRNGNAYGVVIPVRIIEIMGIKLGDYLNIDWGEIIKVEKKKKDDEDIEEVEDLPEI